MRHLGQICGVDRPENKGLGQIVYRLSPTSYLSDPWKRTVLQQCHGQSIRNIVKTLYLDELRKGAWLVDIGIWKSLFDRTVLTAIRELADEGYICVLAGGENLKDAMTTKAKNKSGMPELRSVERPRTVESAKRLTSGPASPAKSSNELFRVPESDISVNGRRMVQVNRRTVATGSAPVGVTPEALERLEDRNGNGDAVAAEQGPVEIPRLLRRKVHAGICAAINIWRQVAGTARR